VCGLTNKNYNKFFLSAIAHLEKTVGVRRTSLILGIPKGVEQEQAVTGRNILTGTPKVLGLQNRKCQFMVDRGRDV
jgi:hypothetical protein